MTDQRQNDNQPVKELGIVPGQTGGNNAGLDKTDDECADHAADHGSDALSGDFQQAMKACENDAGSQL